MPTPPLDRYGRDVLAAPRPTTQTPTMPAERGTVVEEVTTGWCGAITQVEKSGGLYVVELADRHGRTRTFPLGPGFLFEGTSVELTPPARAVSPQTRTASGSRSVARQRARVARDSRIWVEGKHDAELVEKIWGDDLRVEGVVVEMLDGVDDLPNRVRAFRPSPQRRLGVLVDHLVPGSKESRLADAASAVGCGGALVLGHPFVDVWQAVRPNRIGLERWPTIERGVEWKRGVLRDIGWPHESPADLAQAWRRILASVRDYRDVEPALLGRMEELIDFVTVTGTD